MLCKVCFKNAKFDNFHSLFNKNINTCSDCIFESDPIFEEFEIEGYKGISIFRYSEYIRGKIYEYKKEEDIELNDLFISPYYTELFTMFSDYKIVPIPSFKADDEVRGYNHVLEIFKKLKIEIFPCIEKVINVKQKDLNFFERQKIGKAFRLENGEFIKGKKILIVDDVVTTGSSVKAAIKLVEQFRPKRIKILCVARTDPNEIFEGK